MLRRLSLAVSVVIVVSGCQCQRQPTKMTLKHEGEPCMSDEQCDTGLCDGVPVVGTAK
jgi:hypothetical protein